MNKLFMLFLCSIFPALNSYSQTDLFRKQGHHTDVDYIALSPDGKMLISVDRRRNAILWDVASGNQVRQMPDIMAAAFSSDKEHIYLASKKKTFHKINLDGEKQADYSKQAYEEQYSVSRFYPEQGVLLFGSSIYDINKGFLKTMEAPWGTGQDYSPVLKKVAIADKKSTTINICDAITGKILNTIKVNLENADDAQKFLHFSRDGKLLLAGYEHRIAIVETETGKTIRLLNTQSKEYNARYVEAQFSRDGKTILCISPEKTTSIDIQSGKVNWTRKHERVLSTQESPAIDISTDGSTLVTGHRFYMVALDVNSGRIIREFKSRHWGFLDNPFLSEDNSRFVAQKDDEGIIVWNLQNGNMEKTLPIKISYDLPQLVISKDGNRFFTTTGTALREIDTEGRTIVEFKSPNNYKNPYATGLSGKADYIFALYDAPAVKCKSGEGTVLQVFDTKSKKPVFSRNCVDFTPVFANTKNILLIRDKTNTFGFYEIPSGKLLYSIDVPDMVNGLETITFSPTDRYLTFTTADKSAFTVVDLHTREVKTTRHTLLAELHKKSPSSEVFYPGCFTPDEKYLVVYAQSNSLLLFYNLATRQFDEDKTFKEGSGFTNINGIRASANGRIIFIATYQSTIKLYDTEQKKITGIAYPDFEKNNWAVITSSGHFDGNEGAMNEMYHSTGSTLVPLSAMFERFYTPRLLPRLIEGERFLPSRTDVNKLKKAPVVTLGYKESNRNLEVDDDIQIINTKTGTAAISVNAVCPQDGVTEIRLFHNGKLVETTRNLEVDDDVPGEKTLTKSFNVTLLKGDNHFRAIALNTERTESKPAELKVNYTPDNASAVTSTGTSLHLVVIGINTYKNPKYNLNYAEPDAAAFLTAMQLGAKGIFSNVHTHYIKNTDASKTGILEALDKVKANAQPQDLFVFYYAGHGVVNDKQEFYLVPSDVTQLYGNDGALSDKGINAAMLQRFSKEIKAQKQLFILDACQSAGAIENVAAARGAVEEKAIAQLARSTGTHWLTASGSTQFAVEFAQLGHGSFTWCLLEGFKGAADNGDKKITVKELDAWLQTSVPEITQKHKGSAQYPASFSYGNDFPLIIVQQVKQ